MPRDAAEWDARLRSPLCTDADRSAFREWLQARHAHRREFERLQQVVGRLQAAAPSHPALRAMRDEARRRPRPLWASAWAAGAALLAVGTAAWWALQDAQVSRGLAPPAPALASEYRTNVGERATVQLDDGSILTLDTRSRVTVTYTARERRLALLEGRANFAVEHDAARPFVVTAAAREIVALGTQFDVRVDPGRLVVTLLEGRVRLDESATGGGASAAPQIVNAGEQANVDLLAGTATIAATDVQSATSWREGRVYLDDLPLAEAVDELNRYAAAPIVLVDKRLGRRRVNGMFYTAAPHNLVPALARMLHAPTRTRADGSIEIGVPP